MKITAILCVVLCVVVVMADNKLHQAGTVKYTNQRQDATWTAAANAIFEGRDYDSIKHLMGWKKDKHAPKLPKISIKGDAPASFDSRQQWTNCSSIGTIQNQAECGACWAFGAVEAITDRMCIHKGDDTQLSFEDMLSCTGSFTGCNGGDASIAWQHAKNPGLVSEKCYPYSIPTCPPDQQPCMPSTFVKTPKCASECNDTSINFKQDKRKISTVYSVKSSAMETEMSTNGPFEACFTVYEDFLSYKSGVYKHLSGKQLGGHCVKLLGYGTLNGTDYWLAANSWTTTWGDNGFFMIARGTNECGIEGDVVAGMP